MRQKLGIIAGATALAAIAAVASQTDLLRHEDAALQPGQHAAPPASDSALQAQIDWLTTTLAQRAAAYDQIAASLTGSEAEVTRLNALLAARDTELAALTQQLEALRERARLDSALVALKDDGTSAARLEAARFDVGEFIPATEDPAQTPQTVDALVGALIDQAKDPADPRDLAERRLSAIHFDPSSARLSPGGRAHAAAAAVTLEDMKVARVQVIGHTDRVGSPGRNRALAEARARAVAAFLVAAGLPEGMIEIVGLGEAESPVATDDGVAEPLNRCVEILVTET